MRVTVLDYGAGNLHSLCKALARTGNAVTIEPDPVRCVDTDLLVLPGVGAFGWAAQRIAAGRDSIRSAVGLGLPVIGICLGMQLLFEESDEAPGAGLGILAGPVTRIAASRVPHMGWNPLVAAGDRPLERATLAVPYYANSFACRPADDSVVRAWCRHEDDRFPAIVRSGHVTGVQFHPEKSGEPGVAFLAHLVREGEAACS